MEPRFRVAIPARYGSTRLPGKPLRLLAGRPMIEHVYRRALASGAEEVVIATDDERIRRIAEDFGALVVMTATELPSGTDRLAQLADLQGWADDDIVVNLQGDEPLMPPSLIHQAALGLVSQPTAGIATLCVPIQDKRDVFNPHWVKVVADAQGFALYFSRAPIPYHRDAFPGKENAFLLTEENIYFRHIGLYAYRVSVLRQYPQLSPCPLERIESLEQLRALWHGISIYVQQALEIPQAGIDTEEDLLRVENYLANHNRE